MELMGNAGFASVLLCVRKKPSLALEQCKLPKPARTSQQCLPRLDPCGLLVTAVPVKQLECGPGKGVPRPKQFANVPSLDSGGTKLSRCQIDKRRISVEMASRDGW